jgi:hypothetical protein
MLRYILAGSLEELYLIGKNYMYVYFTIDLKFRIFPTVAGKGHGNIFF